MKSFDFKRFEEFLEKIYLKKSTINDYSSLLKRLAQNNIDYLADNIFNLLNNYKNYNLDHKKTYNALKRFYEYLVYEDLLELGTKQKRIPDYYFQDCIAEKIVIPSCIEEFGNYCFGPYLKHIYFEEGCLSGTSGSSIFKDAVNLKRVYASRVEDFLYKYDTFGHPYFKGVGVYLNNKQITPVVEFNISKGFSTWRVVSKHISSISIKDDECEITYSENNNITTTKIVKLTKIEYYGLIECLMRIGDVCSSILNFTPKGFDFPSPNQLSYSVCGLRVSGVYIEYQNNSLYINRLRSILEEITKDKYCLV